MPGILDNEPVLIARAQRGNLDAFNELVLHYQDAAFTLAYRLMGDRASAADTAQEAIIAAYRKLNTYRGGSFRAWLLRIVTNRCYDELRRAQRRPTISLSGSSNDDVPEPLDVPAPDATPEEEALARELQRAIQDCINELNADQRLVLVLSDIEGLSYEEIAAQSGSQLGTVKSRLSRARANVRDCLAEVRELLPAQFRLREET
ncbi:MAG: sigma-70 family RNA polymerase sigma factor [Anaerolineae bacterium]|nr:sigma-70 family RNA polymerase sigma factor [Anaerolineae bacterium]